MTGPRDSHESVTQPHIEHRVTNDSAFNRRQALAGSAALALGAAVGCRNETQPELKARTERLDVPLRIAMCGSDQDAESISRGWGALTEQPLRFRSLGLNRGNISTLWADMLEAATVSDVLIYPVSMMADASLAKAIVAISEDDFETFDQTPSSLFSALRNGVVRYAGDNLAIPLGAALPALLSVDAVDESLSWQAYDELVEKEWDGAAAEPSAPGWAAAMFLWRAANAKTWLFRREDLTPVIDTEFYVQSLELMVQTHSRYKSPQQTPQQVWAGVSSGELKAGLGFPGAGEASGEEIRVNDAPAGGELSRVLLDPFSPVISISASCRQTAAAKRFIQWISGGEGSDDVRRQIEGMTAVRSTVGEVGELATTGSGGYRRWLEGQLAAPLTLPTLRLLDSSAYYETLDRQVTRALEGDATPQQALSEVATQWRELTKQADLAKQMRAWRRAQGMRG